MSSPFCEECGMTFERDIAKFCHQCRTPRGTCPDGAQMRRQFEVPLPESLAGLMEMPARSQAEEAMEHPQGPTEEQDTEDFYGPPAREAIQRHPQQKAPTYNMIFDPPSHNRVKNKLYGRRCLKHEYPIQHKCYVNNYKRRHAWINEG